MFIRYAFSQATFVKLETYDTWISYGKGIISMNFDVQQNNTYGIEFYYLLSVYMSILLQTNFMRILNSMKFTLFN